VRKTLVMSGEVSPDDRLCEMQPMKKPATGFPARVNSCDGANMQVICPTCQSAWRTTPRERSRSLRGARRTVIAGSPHKQLRTISNDYQRDARTSGVEGILAATLLAEAVITKAEEIEDSLP
jgi:hypothetical protein